VPHYSLKCEVSVSFLTCLKDQKDLIFVRYSTINSDMPNHMIFPYELN
jgi:hypothetical protein